MIADIESWSAYASLLLVSQRDVLLDLRANVIQNPFSS